MTDHPVEDDSQIVEDVLPLPTEELAVPVELNEFKPWHLPRKQFIREKQWLYFAKRLIENEKGSPGLPDQGEPEVRYLTLPGIDYLDARIIGHACNELQCKLITTGFLVGKDPYIARAKMREQALIDSGYISDKSFTRPSLFEDLANKKSQAYRDISQKGPFHIVNVDACGSIARPTAQHARRLIDAIYQLVIFQFTYKPGAWLFFLTTDARPNSVAEETVCRLWGTVEENARGDIKFRHKVLSLFGLPDDADISGLHKSVSHPGEKFLRLFSLGFGKWLLHLASESNYRMRAHSAYCYSTTVQGDETPTMACLAFEFVRKPDQADPFGVARSNQKPVDPTHAGPSEAVRVARKMGEMDNLDLKMKDDQLRRAMADATKSLLEEAGYLPEVLQQL